MTRKEQKPLLDSLLPKNVGFNFGIDSMPVPYGINAPP